MSASANSLQQECATLAAYLVGVAPDAYVRRKYLEAHADGQFSPRGRFDGLLIGLARGGTFGARLADAYARIFTPKSALRKKLVLLLAILETCAPSFHLIDDLDSNSRLLLLLRISGRTLVSLIALLAATPFLLPVQLVLAPIDKER